MYDLKKYSIVEISEGDWGIQYDNGPLTRGFTTKQNAIDKAADLSTTEVFNSRLEPQNLEQAEAAANTARENYSIFLAENPTATEEQKEVKIAEIAAAQAYVNEYQSQLTQAANQANATTDYDSLVEEIQVNNADIQRRALAAAAVTASGTPDEQEAVDKAFQAELLYNQMVEQQEAADIVNPTSFNLGGIFSSIGSNLLGGITNSIQSSLGGLAGSLTNISGLGTNFAGNAGVSSPSNNTGTEVYNSAMGQSAAAANGDPRVRLTPKPSVRSAMLSGILAPLAETDGLVFPYTPTISQSGQVTYEDIATVHANQTWKAYNRTENVTIDISGTFTAQNQTEAKYFLAAIHFLRVVTKMHFGESDDNKGLPPPQMILDGYGTYMYNGLSVIIKNYSVDYTNTTDFVAVETGEGTSWVPAIGDLRVQCEVQQTPKIARGFNWDNFASGQMVAGGGWI